MPLSIDLDAYLQRIKFGQTARPDLSTLNAVATAHTSAIPFENLNPWLGIPVDLDLDSVQRKLVQDSRGGYCFEQNLLFGEALRAIGFEVTNLAARVLWGQPEDAITARSHMLLRVDLDGHPWIVDVGFGGVNLTSALRLIPDLEQTTPHEPFRLTVSDGDWWMQARVGETWRTLYRFDLQRQYPLDYRASNYFLSTHPASMFTTNLIASRPATDRRWTLNNREFATHRIQGKTERRTLRNTSELRDVLEHTFLIRLPSHPDFDQRLDALPD
ncbi:MAG: arylamine N-acetyltransferase [Isosphaeraceae bacterium]